MLIPACGLWWKNAATARLRHIRAGATGSYTLSHLFLFPDLPWVSSSGQTQKGAGGLESLPTAVGIGQSCGTQGDNGGPSSIVRQLF